MKATPFYLPHAFIQFWKELQCQYQRERGTAHAWRKLISGWNAWKAGDPSCAIPGYETAPPAAPYRLIPRGWSYTNLCRHRVTQFEQRILRA